jgi:hypothetical protein
VSSAQPNVVVMSGLASSPPSGDLNIGAPSVSGQRETANAFHVNGANVQEDVNIGIAQSVPNRAGGRERTGLQRAQPGNTASRLVFLVYHLEEHIESAAANKSSNYVYPSDVKGWCS